MFKYSTCFHNEPGPQPPALPPTGPTLIPSAGGPAGVGLGSLAEAGGALGGRQGRRMCCESGHGDVGLCMSLTIIWERGEPQRGHPPPIPLPLVPYHWHCRHPPLCPAKPCHGQQPLSEAGWVSGQHRPQAPRQGSPLRTTVRTPLSGHNQGHLLRAPVPRPLWSLRTSHIIVLCFRTISINVAELMHTKIHFF